MTGSEREFNHAFEAYSDELFRHCALRLRDRERAVELTQECFLRAWDYVQKGETIDQIRPFLYRTLRHLIIDEYRKKKSVSLEGLVAASEGDVEDLLPPDESNTIEAALVRHEGGRVLEALTRLDEPYREAVTMRYVDGLSPQEIGIAIGESQNVVSVRVHRGLKKLRDLLEPAVKNHHE
jgi:RNA polymerase sigma-70 factor (ECF subfamily)